MDYWPVFSCIKMICTICMLIILVYYFASKQWWSSQQAALRTQLTDSVTSVSARQRTLTSVNHYSNETKQQKRHRLHSSVLLSRVVQERNARADASFSQRYSERPLSHDSHARTDDRDDQCVFMPPSAVISTQCFKQGLMDAVPPWPPCAVIDSSLPSAKHKQ